MTIGEKIKLLRKKNDLTQEKLADYLCVSYQAVSKWECGLSNPDISLIAPLTRIFHISADELLCLTPEITDERKLYFDAEYHEFYRKDDIESNLKIAQQAVKEYPGDFRYLYWLASAEWYVGRNKKYAGQNKGKELLESSIHHNLMILEDCDDPDIRNKAIAGLVYANNSLNQRDEAKKYALMYPDDTGTSREKLLAVGLKGDELIIHRQKMLRKELGHFCNTLFDMWIYGNCDQRYVQKALEAQEAITRIIIDDDNFNGFNNSLYFIRLKQAEMATTNGMFDEAIRFLEQAKKYAIDYDKTRENGIGKFTCLLLDRYEEDYTTSRIEHLLLDSWKKEISENKIFDILRDRSDFQSFLN